MVDVNFPEVIISLSVTVEATISVCEKLTLKVVVANRKTSIAVNMQKANLQVA